MKYVSTRGIAPALGFSDVLLAGLARDGGLYVPETWPTFTAADFAGWCREAGFRRTAVIPLGGPASAGVAYK